MTFSLVIALPGLALAASDTRITIEIPDQPKVTTDDRDYQIHTSTLATTIPLRMRKIRPVGSGWAAAAGDFLTVRRCLDLLEEKELQDPQQAFDEIRENFDTISQEARIEGFSDAQIAQTVVLVAPFAQGYDAWPLQLAQQHIPNVKSHLHMLQPPGMEGVAEGEVLQFEDAVHEARSLTDIVRAIGRVFAVAAEACPTCGPLVQIGITAQTERGPSRGYIWAPSQSLAVADEPYLHSRRERLSS